MPTITVITVTYQAGHELGRTAESVLAQDYAHVEHLIIDGASTDDTLTVAAAYKQRSDHAGTGHTVRIVSERDRGIYDAMNKGLALATGDYVVFMNAGDRLHSPHTLTEVAALVGDEGRRAAIVYGDTDVVDDEGRRLYRRRLTPPEVLTWRSFRNGMRVCHQSFYAATALCRDIHYDLQYRFSADVDWCIRVMKAAEKAGMPIVNAHQTLTDYLEEGQTTRNHRASLRERFRVMAHHYGLPVTIVMHAWFALRQLVKKGKN